MESPSARTRSDRTTDLDRAPAALTRWAPWGLASVVHAAVLAFLLGGLALLVLGHPWPVRLLGVVTLLPLLVLVRPRPRHSVRPDPVDAPVTTALAAEVAAAVGAAAPTRLDVVEGAAACAYRDLRGRHLELGAALWVALDPPARVALIAHELGRGAHRDPGRSLYVGLAALFLRTWGEVATPEPSLMTLGHTPVTPTLATWPMRALATGYLRLLVRAAAAGSRRAVRLADADAVAIAGSAATLEMARTSCLAVGTIERAVNRAAVDPRHPDLAAEIRTRVAALDAADHAAALTAPIAARIDRLEALPATAPSLVLDRARVAAIDAELRPVLEEALRRSADRYR